MKEDNSTSGNGLIIDNAEVSTCEKNPVNKGQTILTSIPFAFVLKGSSRGIHCDNCLRKKKQGLQRCSSCTSSYYCNTECQKTSWQIHKKECKYLRKLKPKFPPDTARLMARVIFKLQEGGNDIEEEVAENKTRKFKDLVSHVEDIKSSSKKLEHFEATYVVLKSYIGEDQLPPAAELLEMFGKVNVNGFTMTDKDLNGVGLGVYLAASIFDHSCKPNIYASFNGTNLVVKALYDLPDLDFKKMRMSYIDVLDNTENRIKQLQEGYFFTCQCSMCLDKTREKIITSICCQNDGCPQPVFTDSQIGSDTVLGPCTKCGFNDFSADTKKRYLETVAVTKEKLQEMKTNDKDSFRLAKSLLEQQEGLFHKLNILRVKTLDFLAESAINISAWDEAILYGNQNLDGIKYYYGSNHPMYGVSLLKLAKIENYNFKMEEAFNHLSLAQTILSNSHSTKNPIFHEELYPLFKQVKQEIGMMQKSGFNVLKNSKIAQ